MLLPFGDALASFVLNLAAASDEESSAGQAEQVCVRAGRGRWGQGRCPLGFAADRTTPTPPCLAAAADHLWQPSRCPAAQGVRQITCAAGAIVVLVAARAAARWAPAAPASAPCAYPHSFLHSLPHSPAPVIPGVHRRPGRLFPAACRGARPVERRRAAAAWLGGPRLARTAQQATR